MLTHLNNQTNNLKNSFWNNLGSGLQSFFTSLVPFGNLIDNGIGLISGISNNVYDRQLQERLFERDDTSLDRTMEMYRRNGINPLLALPNAQAGNTRGPEPGNIQSDFNQDMLNKLALDKMKNENEIARENLKVQQAESKARILNADLEAQILRSKINAAKAYGIEYYDAYKDQLPYSGAGVYPLDPKTKEEKLFRIVLDKGGTVVKDAADKVTAPAQNVVDQASNAVDQMSQDSDLEPSKEFMYKGELNYVHKASGLHIVWEPTLKHFEVTNGPWIWNVKGKFDSLEEAKKFCEEYKK